MENTITNRQLVFILFLALTTKSAINVAKLMAENAGVGNWITLLTTSIIFGILTVIIIKLNNMFKGKVLFDYSKELVGKFGCYILSTFYILHFLYISVGLTLFNTNFIKSQFLFKTPEWATAFIIISVCGYAAYKGITNVARLFEFIGILFLIAAVSIHIMMFINGNMENILPLYIPSETGKYFFAVKNTIMPFLGIAVLFVIPFTEKNGKKAEKIAFFTLIGIGIFYIFEVGTTIMMLGMNETVFYTHPAIISIRRVEISFIDFLRRFDILVLPILLTSSNAGIIIIYLTVVEYVCRMLPKVKRALIVTIVGLVIYILHLIASGINIFEKVFNEAEIYLVMIAAAIIPITLFIIAKVKKKCKKI